MKKLLHAEQKLAYKVSAREIPQQLPAFLMRSPYTPVHVVVILNHNFCCYIIANFSTFVSYNACIFGARGLPKGSPPYRLGTNAPEAHRAIEVLAIPLGCLLELDDKTLLLKAGHTLDSWYKEIMLEQS